VLLFGEDPGAPTPWSAYLDRRAATLVDPQSPAAAAIVGGAVLDALPAEARLAAARRLPGLRPWFAARLTSEVSVSNAAFALASGVPSVVPILGIPISAADTISSPRTRRCWSTGWLWPAERRPTSSGA